MYSPAFLCIPLHSYVFPCIPLHSYVFPCIPMYSPVFSCIPRCIPLYSPTFPSCIPLYSYCVFLCIALYSYVFPCIPLYFYAFPCCLFKVFWFLLIWFHRTSPHEAKRRWRLTINLYASHICWPVSYRFFIAAATQKQILPQF